MTAADSERSDADPVSLIAMISGVAASNRMVSAMTSEKVMLPDASAPVDSSVAVSVSVPLQPEAV